jgi:TonB family protein
VARFRNYSCGLIVTLVCAAHLLASSAPPSNPSEFYIVSVGFSDALPGWHRSILEVRPEGPDLFVRYIRVMPFSNDCGEATKIVWTAVRLPSTTLSTLTAGQNLCAVRSSDLPRTLRSFPPTHLMSFGGDTWSIVAKCGTDARVLRLPGSWTVDMARLKQRTPKTAALWTLESRIGTRAFGSFPSGDVIPSDLASRLLSADDALLDELKSGRFDAGLQPGRSFKDDVALRRTANDALGGSVKLVDAGRFRFEQYFEPQYPPLAKQARIGGAVELQLGLNRETGTVQEVKVLSGHPILTQAAKESAQRWRFARGSGDGAGSIRIVLEFIFRCP